MFFFLHLWHLVYASITLRTSWHHRIIICLHDHPPARLCTPPGQRPSCTHLWVFSVKTSIWHIWHMYVLCDNSWINLKKEVIRCLSICLKTMPMLFVIVMKCLSSLANTCYTIWSDGKCSSNCTHYCTYKLQNWMWNGELLLNHHYWEKHIC